MLVAALNACMMLTFVAFAQGKKLEFVAYEAPQKACWKTSMASTGLWKSASGQS